jgi:hypothetical protein
MKDDYIETGISQLPEEIRLELSKDELYIENPRL